MRAVHTFPLKTKPLSPKEQLQQYNLYTQKKQFTNGNIDVREIRTIINTNQTLSDTLNEINPQNI